MNFSHFLFFQFFLDDFAKHHIYSVQRTGYRVQGTAGREEKRREEKRRVYKVQRTAEQEMGLGVSGIIKNSFDIVTDSNFLTYR